MDSSPRFMRRMIRRIWGRPAQGCQAASGQLQGRAAEPHRGDRGVQPHPQGLRGRPGGRPRDVAGLRGQAEADGGRVPPDHEVHSDNFRASSMVLRETLKVLLPDSGGGQHAFSLWVLLALNRTRKTPNALIPGFVLSRVEISIEYEQRYRGCAFLMPCIVYRGNSVIALKRKKALLCCSVIVISKSS